MPSTRYLIVGGGMTAAAAAKGIREHDADGSIAIVGVDPHPPYKRPPLSKGLWSGGDEAKIWLGADAIPGLELELGRRIVSLDLDARRATDDGGGEHGYERLLLATGGRPRELGDAQGVVYYRTLDDYRGLRKRAASGPYVVVIGGGFIGSELAASLVGAGCRVTMVFPEAGIGARLFPAGLSEFVNGYYRERGVEVLAGETVDRVEESAKGARVTLGSGRTIEADAVVAGLGILPSTELAEAVGLRLDNGIVVDDRGRVEGRDDVFAAGDVASFPFGGSGARTRVEHEDHANTHGRVVGANMAGADVPYDHLPFFYSDLFDLGYEAVGHVDSRRRVVERWEEPNRKGVVAYLDDAGSACGFLLWNTWNKVDAASELIAAGRPFDESTGL